MQHLCANILLLAKSATAGILNKEERDMFDFEWADIIISAAIALMALVALLRVQARERLLDMKQKLETRVSVLLSEGDMYLLRIGNMLFVRKPRSIFLVRPRIEITAIIWSKAGIFEIYFRSSWGGNVNGAIADLLLSIYDFTDLSPLNEFKLGHARTKVVHSEGGITVLLGILDNRRCKNFQISKFPLRLKP